MRQGPVQRVTLLTLSVGKYWRPFLVIVAAVLIGALIWGIGAGRRKSEPAVPLPEEPQCGLPGSLQEGLYGRVPDGSLPWSNEPPARLRELQQDHGAHTLVAAFRTTLPNPFFDEQENVALAARHLAGTVVGAGKTMSLNRVIGPYTQQRGYGTGPMYSGGRVVPSTGGGVCKVASTLYNAAVDAGLTIVERHPHSMPVPYVPPGRDAAVVWGYKDLRIANPYDTPVVIWAEVQGNTLYVAVYGSHVPPKVEWYHEELAREPTWTIRRPTPDLAPGDERVVFEGSDGVTVRTWLVVTGSDGLPVRKDLGVDRYRPMPRLEEYGDL